MRRLCGRSQPVRASPPEGPHAAFQLEMLRLRYWLRYYHQSGTHNSTPCLPAARADIPVRQHRASNAPSLSPSGYAKLYLTCIPGSLRKQEFHSRELLRVRQQQCLRPPPQTRFSGAKQVSVIQRNCTRYLGKCLAPGVRMCFSKDFPIKIKVPDKLWVQRATQ